MKMSLVIASRIFKVLGVLLSSAVGLTHATRNIFKFPSVSHADVGRGGEITNGLSST